MRMSVFFGVLVLRLCLLHEYFYVCIFYANLITINKSSIIFVEWINQRKTSAAEFTAMSFDPLIVDIIRPITRRPREKLA